MSKRIAVICTRLEDSDRAWLEIEAKKLDLALSDIVRAAVKYYRERREAREAPR